MRIISILALCVALFFQIGVSTAYANDSVSDVFDIDANGEKEALTDGLLLIRYLFGFRDTNLTENAVGDGAVRATSTDIETYIGANLAIFDIDDNGTTDALTDGLLLIRHLFGFRDDALIENAISTGANRELAPDVVNYIETASIAPPAMIALPLDFELAADSYTIDQFGGAVFAIEADPDNAANNTLKMTRPLGAQWWAGGTIALDTPVDATSGVYSYDLYSTTPLAYVELKFEQDGANFVIMTTTHGGTGWETLSFDTSTGAMTGAPSAAALVVFTPRITADGSHTQTADEMYFFDNIQANGSAPPPPTATVALPLDFELAADSYTIDQFGGAVFAIEADPDNAANNTLKMTRPLGAEWWAGGTVALDTPVDATSGVYSYDLYSTTPLAYVELKFEQDGANFVIMTTTHGGTGWETLSFDTSTGAMTGAPSAAALVVFTPRITADGSHTQTADEMYFFDNIQANGSAPPPPTATVALPLDFELAANSYTINQFGGAVFAIEAAPDNASNNTLKMTRPLGAQWWAGGTIALDTPVDATSGVYSYDLYSTSPLAYVELKFEQDGANFVIMTTTHGGTGWETLSFDTSTGAMTGAPSAAGLVVFTPRITADGSHNQTVDEMYFFDNIQTDI